MSFINVQTIPSPEEFMSAIPMSEELKAIKAERDEELKNIFEGKDDRFLVIVGPCSASDEDAVLDYTYRLAKLNDKVKEKLFIVPRIYTNKPRTTGDGYKGMLHQPDPTKGPNILAGLEALRKMHIRSISETHLTAADEMLYPENYVFLHDILSYIAIGARSVENQQHRLVSSGIDFPVGMKNPTSGDFSVMLNAIYAAQSSHTFLYRDREVSTHGNPLAHAILRGYVNKHGQSLPNYHYEDLELLADMYFKRNVLNPFVVVDVNHANSGKIYSEQPRIVKEVLHSRSMNPTLYSMVRGVMIESFIVEGSQKPDGGVYGKSITDACIGWDDTEKLLLYMADHV
ncbi:3-deoxy-7-phosphoheptulonate synthase [Lachnospiraceae bacterium NSJ-143]|nr:3-deoxy-7-phosphoheptulonate synthase [Lachnospiraceae bacterium NSJ-143]